MEKVLESTCQCLKKSTVSLLSSSPPPYYSYRVPLSLDFVATIGGLSASVPESKRTLDPSFQSPGSPSKDTTGRFRLRISLSLFLLKKKFFLFLEIA